MNEILDALAEASLLVVLAWVVIMSTSGAGFARAFGRSPTRGAAMAIVVPIAGLYLACRGRPAAGRVEVDDWTAIERETLVLSIEASGTPPRPVAGSDATTSVIDPPDDSMLL